MIHPSEYLRDELAERGWDADELAVCTMLPCSYVTAVVDGTSRITPEMAWPIGRALGTSTDLWLNLQQMWDER